MNPDPHGSAFILDPDLEVPVIKEGKFQRKTFPALVLFTIQKFHTVNSYSCCINNELEYNGNLNIYLKYTGTFCYWLLQHVVFQVMVSLGQVEEEEWTDEYRTKLLTNLLLLLKHNPAWGVQLVPAQATGQQVCNRSSMSEPALPEPVHFGFSGSSHKRLRLPKYNISIVPVTVKCTA